MAEKRSKENKEAKNAVIQLGKLYEFSIEKEIPGGIMKQEEFEMQDLIPYDRDTGNAHLIPRDGKIAKDCSDFIHKKAQSVLDEIQKRISNNEDISCTMKQLPKAQMFTTSKHGFEKTEFKNALFLFTYIRVVGKYTNYDLMFNRFFFKDNKVNCILKCFQIEMTDKIAIKNYPETSSDGGYGRKVKRVYYNFYIPKKYKNKKEIEKQTKDIDLPAEKIAKAFLDFVVKCENKKANK